MVHFDRSGWTELTKLLSPVPFFCIQLTYLIEKSLVYRHVVFGSVMTSQSMLLQIGYIMYICTLKIPNFLPQNGIKIVANVIPPFIQSLIAINIFVKSRDLFYLTKSCR